MGFLVLVRHEWHNPLALNRKSLIFLLLSGVATGLSWLCYYRALQLGNVAKVAPLDKLSVALTIFLAFIFLKETMDWKTILGGLLIVSGSIVLVI